MTKYVLQFEDGWRPETVWCVKSHSSFIVTRRRGTVTVTGNTEGYDEPKIACVAIGRPTKSRALYCQMLGRGTRGGPNRPIDGKKDCLVLDFVGNSGRHDIVCGADILGGDMSEDELDALKAQLGKDPLTVEEALARAREAEEKRRAEEEARAALLKSEVDKRKGIVAEVRYSARVADPFVAFNVRRDYMAERYGFDRASDKQVEGLKKWLGKHAGDLPDQLSKHEASRMLGAFAKRRESGATSTYGQIKVLAKHGLDGKPWSFERASQAIDAIAKNGWRAPAHLFEAREPGGEG